MNGARQIALGHGRRDLRNGAHLGGEVGRQQIHVAGQILPGSGGSRHIGLASQAPFDTDFASHRGDLVGESGQGIRHIVDGLGQRRDLALGCHRQILLQIAVGDRGHHFDDAAHLLGQIRGHHIDRVGQVLPGARHARHLRLSAEAAFGAHLARHARDFAGEPVELIDHGIDRILELQDLAFDVHRNLARQVSTGNRRGHFGDVSHLGREIRRQKVHVVRQILQVPATREPRLGRPDVRPSPLRAPRV